MNDTTHAAPTKTYRYARGPAEHGHHRVTFVELFFDLVFVFAITQLSHSLIEHPSAIGLYETVLLSMAVWWSWIFTSWNTNWANPDNPAVRIMLFVSMALGLVMSMSIPQAFENRAMAFALAYSASQVGRAVFLVYFVMRELTAAHVLNMTRVLLWMLATAILWIVGAYIGGTVQVVLWTLAVAIEYAGPAMRFYVPVLGRSPVESWEIEPAHFAERCALFIIIVLGESILVTGATFAKLPWTFAPTMAFIASFICAIAMWTIYFNIGQERGVIVMRNAEHAGLIARAYTYVHLIIVFGVIVTAVGDEFALVHATGHTDGKTVAAVLGGPFIYLLGCTIFKRATAGWFPLSHLVGLAGTALLVPVAHLVEPWALSLLVSSVLFIVAIWEHISLGPDGVNKIGDPRKRAKSNPEIG